MKYGFIYFFNSGKINIHHEFVHPFRILIVYADVHYMEGCSMGEGVIICLKSIFSHQYAICLSLLLLKSY